MRMYVEWLAIGVGLLALGVPGQAQTLPAPVPTATLRPRHPAHPVRPVGAGGPHAPRATPTDRPTRTPRGGGELPPTPTLPPTEVSSTSTPTPTPTPTFTATPDNSGSAGLAACDNGCDYGTSQIRMTWYNYNGLLFSMFIRPSLCAPLDIRPGDTGTITMGNFLTAQKRDTGLSHHTTFVMNDSQSGTADNGGSIQFNPGAGGTFFEYNAPLPPLANRDAGEDFPVSFDMCVTVGYQSVKTRLVCQPHAPGMLCHAG